MKNAVAVHVVHSFDQLLHLVLNPGFRQVVPASTDGLLHVHVHQLEDKRQPPRRFVLQHLQQLYDVRVGRQPPQGLDLAQVVNLIYTVEMVLHALYCHLFSRLYALGL